MKGLANWLTSFWRKPLHPSMMTATDWRQWQARHRGNRTLERVLLEWHRQQSLAAHGNRRYLAEQVNDLLCRIMKRWK